VQKNCLLPPALYLLPSALCLLPSPCHPLPIALSYGVSPLLYFLLEVVMIGAVTIFRNSKPSNQTGWGLFCWAIPTPLVVQSRFHRLCQCWHRVCLQFARSWRVTFPVHPRLPQTGLQYQYPGDRNGYGQHCYE
jgi:hypothetical protein